MKTENHCMAPHCRQFVPNGKGTQFVRKDGDVDRYCDKHATEELNRESHGRHAEAVADFFEDR